MRAFVGLMFARGLLRQSHHRVSRLFEDQVGNPIFGATMSKTWFNFLTSHLSYDNEDTRGARWKQDRFVAFCQIFEAFNANFLKFLGQSDYLAFDENLYPSVLKKASNSTFLISQRNTRCCLNR